MQSLLLLRNIKSAAHPGTSTCPFDDLEAQHLFALWDRFRFAGVPRRHVCAVLLSAAQSMCNLLSYAQLRTSFAASPLPPFADNHVDGLIDHFESLKCSPSSLIDALEQVAAPMIFPGLSRAGAEAPAFSIVTSVTHCMCCCCDQAPTGEMPWQ